MGVEHVSLSDPPEGVAQIRCCVCLNASPQRRTDAVTMIKGYAVCEAHVKVMKNHDFDFAELLRAGNKGTA